MIRYFISVQNSFRIQSFLMTKVIKEIKMSFYLMILIIATFTILIDMKTKMPHGSNMRHFRINQKTTKT